MQAYATAEPLPRRDGRFDFHDKTPLGSCQGTSTSGDSDRALIDNLLSRLADLVVDRLVQRTASSAYNQTAEWLDARDAARYLGIHRDTLRKLAAQRAVPTHQDGPGCKLYFRRDELDAWRRSARPMAASTARLRAVA